MDVDSPILAYHMLRALLSCELAAVGYREVAWHWIEGWSVSLLRTPDGIGAEHFFQRHAMQGLSHLIRQVPVAGGRVPYLAIDSVEGLVALAQMRVTEIHPWGVRAEDVEHPDQLVFDLDPAEDVPFAQVVRAAQEMREAGAARPRGLLQDYRREGAACGDAAPPESGLAGGESLLPGFVRGGRGRCQGSFYHSTEQEGAGRSDLPRLPQE